MTPEGWKCLRPPPEEYELLTTDSGDVLGPTDFVISNKNHGTIEQIWPDRVGMTIEAAADEGDYSRYGIFWGYFRKVDPYKEREEVTDEWGLQK